jgi:murein tripeptide amidase MpaA
LDLLTVANPLLLVKGKRKKVVIVTARVHPGETPSSYVCQGFIEFIISDHPIARLLRDNIVFYIVPMLNPDGVFLGNQRSELLLVLINDE